MKSRIFFIVLLAAIVFYGCSGDDQDDVEKSVPVIVYKVTSKPISKFIRATGSVEGDEDVILYSKVAERVERINVAPGQKAAKNQILVQQKNDILKQGLEIADAALKTAKAQAALTANDYERMNQLYAEKAISPQQYDQAKIAKETAENAYQQAVSMYEQAFEQYQNSFIKAPFDGIVAAVYVKKDQMINMGQPVVQILSPSKMKAKVYLTGNDIQNVKIDQNVRISFPAIPGEEFAGRVNKINTAIDQITKTLEVEIEVISKDNRIKSGIFGEFFIEIENKPNSLVIPETALIPQTEIKIDRETGLQNTFRKFYLYKLDKHTAKMVEVKTGIANNGQIEITDGLSAGDSVIVVGQNIVKDGQTVNVIE